MDLCHRYAAAALALVFFASTGCARDDVPVGYLDLLQELGLAEGIFLVDESVQPARIVPGPQARAVRQVSFPELSERLRARWLQLPAWVEGEPAGIVGDIEPVLICVEAAATAMSAMVASSVSPERCDTTEV